MRAGGRARASHYRDQQPLDQQPLDQQPLDQQPLDQQPLDQQPLDQQPLVLAQRALRPSPPNALSDAERDQILEVLNSIRFCDKSVAQNWATLLDEGVYLASMSTMHRVLRACGQTRERRRQASHPARAKPELIATKPGDVWSWDIERHEALPNRAAMEGRRHRLVAASRP